MNKRIITLGVFFVVLLAVVAVIIATVPAPPDTVTPGTPIQSQNADKPLEKMPSPLTTTDAPPAYIPEPPPPTAAPEPSTPEPEPTGPSEWDESDVDMLARLIWGEARGIPSTMEKAAVVWCVLNRVDDPRWPDTIAEVVTQPRQFIGYSPDYPATEEFKDIAADVLFRWQLEKAGVDDAGRVLPAEYTFFTGNGRRNIFTNACKGGTRWNWGLCNPYND